MRYLIFIIAILLATPAWGLSLSTYSQMQEHIAVLSQSDYNHSDGGSISSHVESIHAFEHYLQGSTEAYADDSGLLSVSANSTLDCYDGVQTFFRSTSEWSDTFFNDSPNTHYAFDFTLSDIAFGASWNMGIPKAGFDVDVYLNGESIYDYSYLFDTTDRFNDLHSYIAEQLALYGYADPPADLIMADLTLSDIPISLDLGSFGQGETFTLKYAISSYVLPDDDDYIYSKFSMSGNLSSLPPAPVPEPATLTLIWLGLLGFAARCKLSKR